MLKHRLRSGVLLGAALLGAVFFLPPPAVLLVLLFICGFAMLEFYALLDARQIPHFKVFGVVGGMSLVLMTWLALRSNLAFRLEADSMALFCSMALIFFRQISHKNGARPWETMAGTCLGILYVAFLFNFITKILSSWSDQEGRFLILYMIVVVKCTDIGAYFIGCAIGKHKLIPRISPGKTWEGVIGGVLAGTGVSVLYLHLAREKLGRFDFHLHDALAIGVLLAVAGVLGDLIESLLKRASGVKDSGSYISGMGGLLDVVDSLLFAAPVMYIYVQFFLAA